MKPVPGSIDEELHSGPDKFLIKETTHEIGVKPDLQRYRRNSKGNVLNRTVLGATESFEKKKLQKIQVKKEI